jgi:hypothetical protein
MWHTLTRSSSEVVCSTRVKLLRRNLDTSFDTPVARDHRAHRRISDLDRMEHYLGTNDAGL